MCIRKKNISFIFNTVFALIYLSLWLRCILHYFSFDHPHLLSFYTIPILNKKLFNVRITRLRLATNPATPRERRTSSLVSVMLLPLKFSLLSTKEQSLLLQFSDSKLFTLKTRKKKHYC